MKRSDISLELDGTINAVYSYIPSNLHRNYFDLLLKTKYSSGLLFYIGDTSLSFFSNYLSLTLINGFLQFETKVDVNFSAVVLKSKVRIDDGRWHRVEIERYIFCHFFVVLFKDKFKWSEFIFIFDILSVDVSRTSAIARVIFCFLIGKFDVLRFGV